MHKHGFVNDSHGNVAAASNTAGPYVVSVFIWKNGWVEWPLSSSLMADASKAAWDYFTLVFNGGQPPNHPHDQPPSPTRTAPPPRKHPMPPAVKSNPLYETFEVRMFVDLLTSEMFRDLGGLSAHAPS